MQSLLNSLPLMLLTLPAVLISLSVHEASHGYVAYKLGDPTARNLGRLTLNPLKHINLFGFIAMLFFRIGWANPVPINARNFKNPKRGMAISAAAGPLSNLCLAAIFTVLLRLVLIPLESIVDSSFESITLYNPYFMEEVYEILHANTAYTVLSLLALMLYLGIILNINLMVFNLIPLPPLDGSRMAYVLLPTDTYFKIMQYEQYIMIAFIVIFATGVLNTPLSYINNGISTFFFKALDMPETHLYFSISDLMSRLPQFTL